jgi:hypothetical protein
MLFDNQKNDFFGYLPEDKFSFEAHDKTEVGSEMLGIDPRDYNYNLDKL